MTIIRIYIFRTKLLKYYVSPVYENLLFLNYFTILLDVNEVQCTNEYIIIITI